MTMDLGELPPPASGLISEISFRRLLASCEDIAAGDFKGREDLKQWQTSPVFHHYIETLQEQLSDLENSSRIDPSLIQLYKQRTSHLSSSLKRAHISDLCRAINALPRQPPPPSILNTTLKTAIHTTDDDSNPPSLAEGIILQTAPPTILNNTSINTSTIPPLAVPKRVPQLNNNNNNNTIANTNINNASSSSSPTTANTTTSTTNNNNRQQQPASPSSMIKPIHVSDAAKKRIETQQRLQDHLTDELAEMASALKTNTKAVESKLKERKDLLDSTETALEKSAADTKAGVARATKAHRRGRMTLCFTCLVLMIIGIGFASMYVFIRVTSFTGYKGVVHHTRKSTGGSGSGMTLSMTRKDGSIDGSSNTVVEAPPLYYDDDDVYDEDDDDDSVHDNTVHHDDDGEL